MKHIKLFENFDPNDLGPDFEKLTSQSFSDYEEYFDKEEVKEVKERLKAGETLYIHELTVDDDYEGFDGTDDYFDSEGHAWDAIEALQKSDYKLDIIGEGMNGEGTYYTIMGDRKSNEELDEAEESVKFSWKQNAKEYGKSSIGHDNELRAWHLTIHGETVASLYNSGFLASNLGGDGLDQWKISFQTTSGPNMVMNKRFEKDQIEDAKKFTEKIYLEALSTPDESENTNMLKIKSRLKVPVKIVKTAETHPYKEVLKLLRAKLGDSFGHNFGTDSTWKPITYSKTFDATGRFTVKQTGDMTSKIKMIQDVLGKEYNVIPGNREIIIKKNETH